MIKKACYCLVRISIDMSTYIYVYTFASTCMCICTYVRMLICLYHGNFKLVCTPLMVTEIKFLNSDDVWVLGLEWRFPHVVEEA